MGQGPSIETECMMGSNWRFLGVHGCPDDPRQARRDRMLDLGCTDTIPSDRAGYCTCDGNDVRIVRCNDVASTCEQLCSNEQIEKINDEVEVYRANREADSEIALGLKEKVAMAILGLLVLYFLATSRREDKSTSDKIDRFVRRIDRDD